MIWTLNGMDLKLIGDSSPEALSELPVETTCDSFLAEAGVRLARCGDVDIGVVVQVSIPVKISFEVRARHPVVPKLVWVFRGVLGSTCFGLTIRIVQ